MSQPYTFSNIGSVKTSGQIVKNNINAFGTNTYTGTPVSASSVNNANVNYNGDNNGSSTAPAGGADWGNVATVGAGVFGGIANSITANDSVGRAGLDTVKNAAPGVGGLIGSALLPGVGTVVGTAIGTGVSGAIGIGEAIFDKSKANKERKENEAIQAFQKRKFEADSDKTFADTRQYNISMYGNSYAKGGEVYGNPRPNQVMSFNGASHENGGIRLNDGSEVEGNEVLWRDYVFSNRLKFK